MKMKRLFKLLIISLLGLSTLAEARLPPIKPGVPGKKKGEIIAPMLDEQVAAWCDFSRQIVVTRSNILCSYNGDLPVDNYTTDSLSHLKPKKAPVAKMAKSRPAPKDLTNLYEMSEYGDV